MKRVNLIPNIITVFSLSCGLFVVFRTTLPIASDEIYELLHASALLLILAGFADLLDGAVARIIGAESDFGAFLDSLSDAISFGVAPALLLLKSLRLDHTSSLGFFAVVGVMIYTICGVLRLARFNVQQQDDQHPTVQLHMGKQAPPFIGLPSPAAGGSAVALNLFLHSPFSSRHLSISYATESTILILTMILLGFLMISKWKFPSLKVVNVRVSSSSLILSTVVVAFLLLYGILHHFALVLVIISLGYVVVGCALNLVRLVMGTKSRTLSDFDPDS